MRKTHRLSIRTSREVHDKLKAKAEQSGTDSVALEARLILEKALGVKRRISLNGK